MGTYLNPGKGRFQISLNSQIYVDKTGLIEETNKLLFTEQRFVCVSRPRRFGKSMAAGMLSAYYGRGYDASAMFDDLEIAQRLPDYSDEENDRKLQDYKEHRNQYNVLFLNMIDFTKIDETVDDMIASIQEEVLEDLNEAYPEIVTEKVKTLQKAFAKIHTRTGIPFVFILDEWDCVMRRKQNEAEEQRKYLDFLRDIFKDKEYVALAYMTGILPIKKYGEHSALNMFSEVSMTFPGKMERFMGFTEQEVRNLCERFEMDFSETKRWYDGYMFETIRHVYSPKSLVDAMLNLRFRSYWTQTETYEALKRYIDINMDGLKDAIISMLAGNRCRIETEKFTNDMTTFASKDDVLTLLIHLGYLAYDALASEVFIPNQEIVGEFNNAMNDSKWDEVIRLLKDSDKLLQDTLDGNEQAVAQGLQKAHETNTSILAYNDENSLSCAITLAYFNARNYYVLKRELPAGKGFADIVFVPRSITDKPAMVVELKYDKSAEAAISQIKEREYVEALADYTGEIVLVGINYDRKSKKHKCLIERVVK